MFTPYDFIEFKEREEMLMQKITFRLKKEGYLGQERRQPEETQKEDQRNRQNWPRGEMLLNIVNAAPIL